ncbi:MAG TPA: hypothetical protein VGX68_25380 [Thermoanaerobaculia bacterium]|jgi:hypothetical protein|nr:hypothetical protein [Thermoanaerobaculia bacterium]
MRRSISFLLHRGHPPLPGGRRVEGREVREAEGTGEKSGGTLEVQVAKIL